MTRSPTSSKTTLNLTAFRSESSSGAGDSKVITSSNGSGPICNEMRMKQDRASSEFDWRRSSVSLEERPENSSKLPMKRLIPRIGNRLIAHAVHGPQEVVPSIFIGIPGGKTPIRAHVPGTQSPDSTKPYIEVLSCDLEKGHLLTQGLPGDLDFPGQSGERHAYIIRGQELQSYLHRVTGSQIPCGRNLLGEGGKVHSHKDGRPRRSEVQRMKSHLRPPRQCPVEIQKLIIEIQELNPGTDHSNSAPVFRGLPHYAGPRRDGHVRGEAGRLPRLHQVHAVDRGGLFELGRHHPQLEAGRRTPPIGPPSPLSSCSTPRMAGPAGRTPRTLRFRSATTSR
jgi:hypothetical protein